MGFIKSYLRDLVTNTRPAAAIGRAVVPPQDDQPTVGLPRAALNESSGYVGRRRDIKARNRSAGPRYRSPEVAL
ncbi:hypothetical protein [Plantactinospora sp. WMMB782]|uniref:hypothetical protein n=1 Tax=Plantactinospora sp. WMMB782 TaxID=3404121 RepID=UPI003B94C40E